MNPRETFTKKAKDLLLGKTVVDVRYMTEQEQDDCYIYNKPVVITLADNKGKNEITIFPMSDDEGNEAGAIFTTDDNCPVIPVV